MLLLQLFQLLLVLLRQLLLLLLMLLGQLLFFDLVCFLLLFFLFLGLLLLQFLALLLLLLFQFLPLGVLLLMQIHGLLLMLLLRNLLKLYTGQGSSALGARLRNRMVLGAVLIALTPAVLMYLFSFYFMNRTIDRWFSPNTSQLRDDSEIGRAHV